MLSPALALNSANARCVPVPLPGRRVVVLAGICLDSLDEFPDRLDVDHVWINGQHVRNVDERRDWREIRLDIERQVSVERRVHAVRRSGPEQYRVAVRTRLRDVIGRDIAAGARAVFGDDPGVERFLHRFLQRARDDVDTRAGWKTHHDGNRLGRPILRERVSQRQSH
jgi:hypothetical protein